MGWVSLGACLQRALEFAPSSRLMQAAAAEASVAARHLLRAIPASPTDLLLAPPEPPQSLLRAAETQAQCLAGCTQSLEAIAQVLEACRWGAHHSLHPNAGLVPLQAAQRGAILKGGWAGSEPREPPPLTPALSTQSHSHQIRICVQGKQLE